MYHAYATSRELRQRAFAALKDTWQTLLILTLVINLISWLGEQGSDIPAASTVASLILAIPTMGILKGSLEHLRGTPLKMECFGSMFPKWTKVLCYELWVILFCFLWMLPGLAVTFMGGAMGGVSVANGHADVTTVGMIALAIGVPVMLVLLFRALLNYSMGGCLLVDFPDMGGRAALKKSKEMMRGNRWCFVKMNLPVFLAEIALVLVTGFMSDTWLATLLASLLGAVTNMLTSFFAPVFYRELLNEG